MSDLQIDTNQKELIRVTGEVRHIVFRNDETYYTVARFRLHDKNEKTITVTGCMEHIEVHGTYDLYGEYVEHPRFGLQFAVYSIQVPLPSEEEGVVRYLSSDQFPGIGRKTAERIYQELGEDCLNILRNDETAIDSLTFLSDVRKHALKDGIEKSDSGFDELNCFLATHGIGPRNIVRLNRTYGLDALKKLKENPYRVIDECDGFGFKTADKIGKAMGIEASDERRLYAMLVSMVMDTCMQTGDTYVLKDEIEHRFFYLNRGITCDFEELLNKAIVKNQIEVVDNRVYPISQYESEEYIASFLSSFPYVYTEKTDEDVIDSKLEVLERINGITYDETQVNAIHAIFKHPFTILTGGPGTGKTTIVKAVCQLYNELYPDLRIQLCAPTGRASKHLQHATKESAMTIHALLGWDLESNRFKKDEDNGIECDLLIVDEFSMVDNWLFASLLRACNGIGRIVVIGDEDQLPSVSPGTILKDLIEVDRFHLVRLHQNYRQEEGSDVIELSKRIVAGNASLDGLTRDVKFFETTSDQVKPMVQALAEHAIDKGYDMFDLQVLAPMYDGAAGIDLLNTTLQEAFNPASEDKREFKYGYRVYREGDKILQLKNQPDDEVFNGDIGILEEIVPLELSENKSITFVVRFDDVIVEYTKEHLDNITHAYCISIHKSQGSEYPIVIMPVVHEHQFMLQKKLLYTGITRASKSLILIGSKDSYARGIKQEERHERMTSLQEQFKQF